MIILAMWYPGAAYRGEMKSLSDLQIDVHVEEQIGAFHLSSNHNSPGNKRSLWPQFDSCERKRRIEAAAPLGGTKEEHFRAEVCAAS